MITRAIAKKGFTLYAGNNGRGANVAVIINSKNQTLARLIDERATLEIAHDWHDRSSAMRYVTGLFFPETYSRHI